MGGPAAAASGPAAHVAAVRVCRARRVADSRPAVNAARAARPVRSFIDPDPVQQRGGQVFLADRIAVTQPR